MGKAVGAQARKKASLKKCVKVYKPLTFSLDPKLYDIELECLKGRVCIMCDGVCVCVCVGEFY